MGLTPDEVEPYGLDFDFETATVTLACARPRFWARVGHAIDPEALGTPEARLALETARVIAKETGAGPAALLLVVQRLRRQMHEGKITLAQVAAVNDMFDRVRDAGYFAYEDAIAAELVPILRRRIQSAAVLAAHDEYARRGDFKTVTTALERASRLGVQENSIGVLATKTAGFDEIDAMGTLKRLPTGVLELDLQLREGLHRTGLGVVLGGSGDGKSQWLVHTAATAMTCAANLFVGFATLELPKPIQLARLYANLTGVLTNDILDDPAQRAEAKRRISVMEPHIGACVVEEFSPHATTVGDIAGWVDRVADQFGRRFDLLVVDYGDKLTAKVPGRDASEYTVMRYVYEGLRRDLAVERDMWVWTASQAARLSGKDKEKRLDIEHVADSMHKVRVADLLITLNARDDGAQLLAYVAKNRLGRARFQAGPWPTDFDRARIAVASSEWADWSTV